MKVIEQYKELHESALFCCGTAIKGHLDKIGAFVKETDSKTLLDYGCGKAKYYKLGIAETWGVDATLYDPGVKDYEYKPVWRFDMVVCVDVLEHVEDPEETVKELFWYAEKAAYIQICTAPSDMSLKKRRLLDGRGLHISVHPQEWWIALFDELRTDISLKLIFS